MQFCLILQITIVTQLLITCVTIMQLPYHVNLYSNLPKLTITNALRNIIHLSYSENIAINSLNLQNEYDLQQQSLINNGLFVSI